MSYNLVDQVTNITQGSSSTSFTYDPLGRRVNEVAGGLTTVRHYTDSSDNPEWTSQLAGANSTTEIYTGSLGAGMGITTTIKNGVTSASMQITDTHGHTVNTINLAGTNTDVSSWISYDSFGNPLSSQTNSNLINYSAYGQQERATNSTGLILMGARVYNPKTNQFTSIDPIPGGNENSYSYPNDPINHNDISGKLDWWLNAAASVGAIAITAGVCYFTAGIGCLVAGVLVSGAGGAAVGYLEGASENLSGWDLAWRSIKSSTEWGTSAAIGGALGPYLRTAIMGTRGARIAIIIESTPKIGSKVYSATVTIATRGYFNLVNLIAGKPEPSVYTEDYLKKRYPMYEYHHGGR